MERPSDDRPARWAIPIALAGFVLVGAVWYGGGAFFHAISGIQHSALEEEGEEQL